MLLCLGLCVISRGVIVVFLRVWLFCLCRVFGFSFFVVVSVFSRVVCVRALFMLDSFMVFLVVRNMSHCYFLDMLFVCLECCAVFFLRPPVFYLVVIRCVS